MWHIKRNCMLSLKCSLRESGNSSLKYLNWIRYLSCWGIGLCSDSEHLKAHSLCDRGVLFFQQLRKPIGSKFVQPCYFINMLRYTKLEYWSFDSHFKVVVCRWCVLFWMICFSRWLMFYVSTPDVSTPLCSTTLMFWQTMFQTSTTQFRVRVLIIRHEYRML